VDRDATTDAEQGGGGDLDQFQDEIPGEILPG